jgi:methionyl-tRNA formyltransferase
MKTLFFGTPALAVPFLEKFAASTELQAVVTTPDEPVGRGYQTQPTPVKTAAEKLRIPVLQPASLKDPAIADQIGRYAPEFVLVVAYGKILPKTLLSIPSVGYVNVHFSLLPAYRGAAPIQRALMHGERQTGVTLFWLDEGMDTGPIFLQRPIPIAAEDDAETLRDKLVNLGIQALDEALEAIRVNKLVRAPQTGAPSLAPPLKKEEGRLDWSRPANDLANRIRGTYPWPGAFTFVKTAGQSQRLKVLKAQPVADLSAHGPGDPGAVVSLEGGSGFVVKCGQQSLLILDVQPEGKRPMKAWDYWQGARLKLGDKLG